MDLAVFASLSYIEEKSIEHTLCAMIKEDTYFQSDPDHKLTEFAEFISSKILRADMQNRVYAGEVVLELYRLGLSSPQRPSLKKAIQHVVYFHRRLVQKKGAAKSVKRAVEQAFSKYRATAHLQAVAALSHSLIEEMEGDAAKTAIFLAAENHFDEFIRERVMCAQFPWRPLEVPERYRRPIAIPIAPLCDEELKDIRENWMH
jgi:hypothetical protein